MAVKIAGRKRKKWPANGIPRSISISNSEARDRDILTFGCDIQFFLDLGSSLSDEFTKNPLRLSFPVDLAEPSAEDQTCYDQNTNAVS